MSPWERENFSLLEQDTLGLQPAPVSLRPAVDEALQSITAKTREGMAVDVDVEVDDEISGLCRPSKTSAGVLKAILDNAAKFHRARGHVSVRGGRGDGTRVRLDVIDDGIGIPGEALPHIFERFFQVDNTATRSYGGTGMGLALVKRLVDAHGAELEVESQPGQGSRFTLYWPATAAAAGGELTNGHAPPQADTPSPIAEGEEGYDRLRSR